MTNENGFTATYSPDDNKLRLYAESRLDKDLYNKVRAEGFRWAPSQKLFVAPKWTPAREDLLLELCGEVGDEDTSLVERAEERADRFDNYSEKRAKDGDAARSGVKSITDHIPLGQPILIGHHSEKRARKDAERIENGMRKAVKMWETSEYWERRAAGTIRHAERKERPDVRARRIKKIEAHIRRCKSYYTQNMRIKPIMQTGWRDPEGTPPSEHVWCGNGRGGNWTKKANLEAIEKGYARWIQHYENRLTYEKALLEAQGGSELIKPKPRPKQLPICNYLAPDGIRFENQYHRGEFMVYPQVQMTKADYSKIYTDHKGGREVENSHRVRTAFLKGGSVCVFLTDSKTHKKPGPIEKQPPAQKARPRTQSYTPPEKTKLDDMQEALKKGVQVVVAPQLFPTPNEIAEKMAEHADILAGESILEPSAGTGVLIGAVGCKCMPGGKMIAVEINKNLCDKLENDFPLTEIINQDFLSCNGNLDKFDKIIMNPPYKNGEDIKHIRHAISFLKPGGRLVALCANGPRQQEKIKPLTTTWEDLPAGTFKEAGTMVNTALITIEKQEYILLTDEVI